MKVGTKLWLGLNVGLVLGGVVLVSNHLEQNKPELAKEVAIELAQPQGCAGSKTIPAEIKCFLVSAALRNDPALIAAVAWQESRFKTTARSQKGACGLMQFMPATAAQYKVDCTDPHSSMMGGDKYLAELNGQFKNHGLALAAYNWGPENVKLWLKGHKIMPRETRAYVMAITGRSVTEWKKSPNQKLAGYVASMKQELGR